MSDFTLEGDVDLYDPCFAVFDNQIGLVRELADDMIECGHDDLRYEHLLDSLASTGLMLVEAPGITTNAYLLDIKRTLAEGEGA